MARGDNVTREQVVAAVEELRVQMGKEPGTIAVQERTGGSFTTVKRLLEELRAQRPAVVVEVPPAMTQLGADLAARLWQQATAQAHEEVARVRAEADEAAARHREALAEAEEAIRRLEATTEALTAQLAASEASAAAARSEVASAAAAAQTAVAERQLLGAQVADLQGQVQRAHAQIADGQAALLQQARELGELGALRSQVASQQALFDRFKVPASSPPKRRGGDGGGA